MAMTQAVKEKYARGYTNLLHLFTVELDHIAFSDPIRLVNYKENVSIGGTQYIGIGMEVEEPGIDTEADSTYTIKIDGVSGYVQPYIAQANKTFFPITVIIKIFAFDVKTEAVIDTTPLSTINLQSRNISFNRTTVSINMGYTNSANKAFPSQLYTPESNPGLV